MTFDREQFAKRLRGNLVQAGLSVAPAPVPPPPEPTPIEVNLPAAPTYRWRLTPVRGASGLIEHIDLEPVARITV